MYIRTHRNANHPPLSARAGTLESQTNTVEYGSRALGKGTLIYVSRYSKRFSHSSPQPQIKPRLRFYARQITHPFRLDLDHASSRFHKQGEAESGRKMYSALWQG